MSKMSRLNLIGSTFYYSGLSQLKQEWVIGMAASVGLMQGLKYGGSVKRGLTGSAYTLGVMFVANGVYNVVTEWNNIKEVSAKEE